MEKDRLPSGWAMTTLGAIRLDLAVGVDPALAPDTVFELYSVPSHEQGMPEILPGSRIGSTKRTVESGTVLLCKINPRINRVWVVGNHSEHTKIASTEWISFSPLSGIDPRYLAYFLRQNYIRDFLAANASGVGGSLMRVKATEVRNLEFRLAPKAEQTRIADLLDELFSRLDAGVVALERVRNRLRRYRSSVLKAAVEGALTADWRTAHPDVEAGSKLLKRILVERRRRWEEDQTRKSERNGRALPKNWRSKYREPTIAEPAASILVPEEWCWATISQCSSRIQYGSSSRTGHDSAGVPVLRMGNITAHGRLVLDDLKYLPRKHDEFPELLLKNGDLVFNRTNSVELVGKTAIYTGDPPACSFASYLIRVRLLKGIASEIVVYALNGGFGRAWVRRVVSQTVGQANVNGSKLASFSFPLPPTAEQDAIIEAVEAQLSIVDRIESDLDAKLKTSQQLRQAILRHAFAGRLVPQDPNDEPASELLKRILNERKAFGRESAAKKPAVRIADGGRTGYRGRIRKRKTETRI